MSEVLIKRKDKSFWINPNFIQLVSQYVCQVFETNGLHEYSQEIQDVYIDFDLNRTGECLSFVSIVFDDITNDTDKATIIEIFNQTKTLIQSLGNEISVASLNKFENAKKDPSFKLMNWSIPVRTTSLVNLLNLFIDLLNDTYPNVLGNVNFLGYQLVSNPNVEII
jgi:hypothetical protein